jgi:hypothetical protein
MATSYISSGSGSGKLLFLPSGTGDLLFLPSAAGRRAVGWHSTNGPPCLPSCLGPARHEKIAFVLVLCLELGT